MFRSAEAEQGAVLSAEQHALLGSQASGLDLALGRETRAAVKRGRTVPKDCTDDIFEMP